MAHSILLFPPVYIREYVKFDNIEKIVGLAETDVDLKNVSAKSPSNISPNP